MKQIPPRILIISIIILSGCSPSSPQDEKNVSHSQSTTCESINLDVEIGARRDGKSWDGLDNPLTNQNELLPDPVGRVWLKGSSRGTERLKLRQDTWEFTAPFHFNQEKIHVEGTEIRIRIQDKDVRDHELIADITLPLEELISNDGIKSQTPNSQLLLRAHCIR